VKIIKDVLNSKELFDLYDRVINEHSWYLGRGSSGEQTNTFPGLIVYDNGTPVHFHLSRYFVQHLLSKITEKCLDQYNFLLPKKVIRTDLVAKQPGSVTKLHIDHDDPNAYSLIGMLTPEWDDVWGGEFYVGEEEVKHSPGSFILIKSNELHNGVAPKIETPYWRIVVNYILV
jgi:hypothetical protein